MRIGFIGTSSTGKSTLSAALAIRLGLSHIPELVNEGFDWANKNGFPVSTRDPRNFNDLDKVNIERGIINVQQDKELSYFIQYGGYVADSAQLQQLMYLLYFVLERTSLEVAKDLYDRGMEHMNFYDVVFYLPFGVLPIEDNGYRITNPLMLMAQDAILRRLMGEARKRGAHIVTIPHTDLNQRIEYATKIVETIRQRQTSSPYHFGIDLAAPGTTDYTAQQ